MCQQRKKSVMPSSPLAVACNNNSSMVAVRAWSLNQLKKIELMLTRKPHRARRTWCGAAGRRWCPWRLEVNLHELGGGGLVHRPPCSGLPLHEVAVDHPTECRVSDKYVQGHHKFRTRKQSDWPQTQMLWPNRSVFFLQNVKGNFEYKPDGHKKRSRRHIEASCSPCPPWHTECFCFMHAQKKRAWSWTNHLLGNAIKKKASS